MNNFHHKKKLGQHFLKDKNIVRKIVQIADIKPDDHVWEIGPGKGILTEELLDRNCILTAFEIDETLFPILEEKFSNKINLFKEDVLKANWKQLLPNEKVKIVANLPYQITSPFLFKIVEYEEHFSKIVIMIQREVAKRIKAKVGSKDYGILTLKMQFYFDVSYEFTVKSHLFNPKPKVDSAVISLSPRKERPEIEDEKYLWRIVETSFRNRRKMLRNNLKEILNAEQIAELSDDFDLSKRGETFTESDFIKLYKRIERIQQ